MARQGTRTKIGEGLYQDATRISAIARVPGARPREKRFKLGTPLKRLLKWQDETRRTLRKQVKDHRELVPPGSLAAAVERSIAPLTGTVLRDTKNLLMHWVAALPPGIQTEDITKADLVGVVKGWQGEGRAASTINHRRRALIALFDELSDNEDAVNPARLVSRVTPPKPEERAIAMELAAGIVEAMPDRGRRRKGEAAIREASKTKARLRVRLRTGLAPATLMRVRPSDVDLERATVYVRPRRKGDGAEGVTLPLLPEGIAAFRLWLRAFAWGKYSTSSERKSFLIGIKRYQASRAADGLPPADLPADLRPYDLRHTFLSWLLEMTGDIYAVKEYAQHADIRSTLRYTQRAASPRLLSAIETVALRRGTGSQESRSA